MVSDETILVVVKFKINGLLRFLSHAETMRLFQRACARAEIKLRYSQGFNPRPKLSLPLPRAVGTEADDDLLSLRMTAWPEPFDTELLKSRLSGQLPEGCQLLDVSVAKAKTPLKPKSAKYILQLPQSYRQEKLAGRIEHLLQTEKLELQRRINAKGNTRKVDVRGFLESIETNGRDIIVKCKITSGGSIRVDEILKLLELNADDQAIPVRRTNVEWQNFNN